MRVLGKLAMAATSLMLAAQPVLASPASKLSLVQTGKFRAATRSGHKSDLSPAVIIGVLATAAIIGGAVALADNDDAPDSP